MRSGATGGACGSATARLVPTGRGARGAHLSGWGPCSHCWGWLCVGAVPCGLMLSLFWSRRAMREAVPQGWTTAAYLAFWNYLLLLSGNARSLETLFSDLDPASRALLSQGGDATSCAFSTTPSGPDTAVPDAVPGSPAPQAAAIGP